MTTLEEARFEDLILPDIIGNGILKEVLSLQIFTCPSQGEKMHILGVGNVASGKTSIALELIRIVPNAAFTGKKITPVGMIEKLVSTDGGILYLDELDKVEKHAREQMLECMQSQHISYDRQGYHVRKPARTNITSFCNPRGYYLNEDIPLTMQTPFGAPLLSRFHFLLPVKEVDSVFYGDIARGMVRSREGVEERRKKLMEYIVILKQEHPIVEVSDSIAGRIGDFVRMVKSLSPIKDTINPRLIEGLISATKARARMEGKSQATIENWMYVKSLADKLCL